jgi:hypothetical protein
MDADPQAYTQITMKKGSFKEPFGAGHRGLDALAVLAGACVNLDLVTLCHKDRNTHLEAGGNLGGL